MRSTTEQGKGGRTWKVQKMFTDMWFPGEGVIHIKNRFLTMHMACGMSVHVVVCDIWLVSTFPIHLVHTQIRVSYLAGATFMLMIAKTVLLRRQS